LLSERGKVQFNTRESFAVVGLSRADRAQMLKDQAFNVCRHRGVLLCYTSFATLSNTPMMMRVCNIPAPITQRLSSPLLLHQ
jgi:hypothetical protein